MRFALAKISWFITGIGVFLMSLSICVQRISNDPLVIEQAKTNSPDASCRWVDYFLNVLEETGEELPGKNFQPRTLKAEFRKLQPGLSYYAGLPYKWAYPNKKPANTYIPPDEIIPEPGYYASLSLLYVF